MKAAVFFADGFEDIEALSPVDYMRRAGIEVITVGVKGTPFNATMIVTSSHKVPMIMDTTLDAFLKEYSDELYPDNFLTFGMSGNDVRKLQRFLLKIFFK